MKKLIKVTEMKKKRISEGLTQGDLAKQLGVAVSSIGGYERGDNPVPSDVAERLSDILKTPPQKLFKNNKAI
jgi:transcriptional regulator with XRE-family HTH domain